MNKKERRKEQLIRHYNALVRLAEACGVKKADGKKLSVKLLKLERIAHTACENYCNGQDVFGQAYGEKELDAVLDPIKAEVEKMFNYGLEGFFINQDPRGYALKIQDEQQRKYEAQGIELQRDWGGYGLLSPEINGN